MFSSLMMLMLDTDYVIDHPKICLAVDDIHSKGFDTVSIELRNSIYSIFDKEGREAVKVAAEYAGSIGMGAVVSLPFPGPEILKKYPEARQKWIIECSGTIKDSAFRMELPMPSPPDFTHTLPIFHSIVRIFRVERQGTVITSVEDITQSIAFSVDFERCPIVSGEYERDGEILAYALYNTDWADYAFRRINESVDGMLDSLDGITLDGVALDEFGSGSRKEDVYLAGEHFLRDYKRKNGYDLLDVVYLLRNEALGQCAAKVRYDYYSLTVDHTYAVQRYLKEAFAKRHKHSRFTGFHHTWWGEGNSGDLWAGNMDYFRLTDVLSGGFTDSQYFSERTMVSMIVLAESLAKYSESREAYNMCWNFNPTAIQMDYFHRLLAVRNVRWIGHGYGRTNGFGPGYPQHFTWKEAKSCTRREKAFREFAGKAESRPGIAMVYTWESAAAFNDRYMHYHRLSMKALLHKCMLANVEIDVIPTFSESLQDYDVIIVPWPAMVPAAFWENVKAYSARGKRIIFTGPPAQYTTEGTLIADEFAALVGIGSLKPSEYKAYPGEYEYDAKDLWFTGQKEEMRCWPLSPASGDSLLNVDGNVIAVKNGNVEYYAFELALTGHFEKVLQELGEQCGIRFPAGVISKLSFHGDDLVLTMTGRQEALLNLEFEFCGHRIEVSNGRLLGIKVYKDAGFDMLCEEGTVLNVDGKKSPYTIV